MQLEQERNQRMREAYEASISSLEGQIERTRAKLEGERGILAKHEATLERKQRKEVEAGITETRASNKRKEVLTLERHLTELTELLEKQRPKISRILGFRPIQGQLDQLPDSFRLAGPGEWEIPNSRFKTFQDIFTPVGARIVPNAHTSVSRKDYDHLSLNACPVDPERVPDWFFDEFALGSLEGLDELERLERKAEHVGDVRSVFEHLTPLEAYERETHRVFFLDGYSREHDGKLLVTSYTGRASDGKDRKTMQFFGSAYEAHRRTVHINTGYQAEQEKIHGIRGRVRGIQQSLIGIRSNDPKMKDVSEALAREIELLGHVTNTFKAQSVDILRDVMDIRDRLGRHNPGATCARLVKALGILERRLPQIFEKSPWIEDDRRILSVEINQGKEVMDGSYRGYLSICRGIQAGETCVDVERRLGVLPSLEGLKVRPFNLYAGKLREKLEAIRRAIQGGDRQTTHDEAIHAYVACKVFEVQHEREKVLRDIVESPMETTIENLLNRASRLRAVVMEKETFSKGRTGFNASYADMVVKIVTLVDRLTHYSKQTLSDPERLAMYERLKKYLEGIEFTDILENL